MGCYPYRRIVRFSLPIILLRVSNSLGNFFSMLIIAQIGGKALAAGALIASLLLTMLLISWAIIFSINITVSRAYGAKQYDIVGIHFKQGFILATIIGVIMTFVVRYIPWILSYLGQDKEIVILVEKYLRAFSWAVLPSMWYNLAIQFLIGLGRPVLSMIWGILGVFILVIVGYSLVFGRFGLPSLGIEGMAYANVIMYCFLFFVAFIYLVSSKKYKKFALFTDFFRPKKYYLREQFLIGWPISVQLGSELMAFTVATIMFGWLGQTVLEAHQVVLQLVLIVLMIPLGISQTLSVLIARSLGEEAYDQPYILGKAALKLGVAYYILIIALFYSFPEFFIGFFLDVKNPANIPVIRLAKIFLYIVAFSQFLDALRNIASGGLRGFHDTKVPMAIGILSSWIIALPLSYFFAFTLDMQGVGIRWAFLMGFFIGMIMVIKRFLKKAKKYYVLYKTEKVSE